jgi:collagenase-like PrtC family protease
VNVYNERTAAFLAKGGACNFCLPGEMPAPAIRKLCAGARHLDATIEVQVFGRLPLALSARCYHARAHGRTKDTCLFVCDEDPDGLELDTLDGKPFLAVNGIQTLSYDYLNLVQELAELRAMGASNFRLSPHDCDMVEVAAIFRAALDGRITLADAAARLDALKLGAPFSNGFYHGCAGYMRTAVASRPAR